MWEESVGPHLSSNQTPVSRWKSSQNRLYVIIKNQKKKKKEEEPQHSVNMLGQIAHPGKTGVSATVQRRLKIIM